MASLLTHKLALPFNPWWVLWVVSLSSPWLIPTHLIPWGAFHSDLLMALVLLPAGFWAVAQKVGPVQLSAGVIAVAALAVVPIIQYQAGMLTFAGDAWISSIYLLGLAIAMMVGARFVEIGPERLTNALFAAIGLASILSVGIELYQWLHLDALGLLILNFPFAGYRPFANLGQPNHLATLLVWGVLALWWGWLRGSVRGSITSAAIAFLLFGIAATQSRTGWLELGAVAAAALVFRGAPMSSRQAIAVLALASLFMALVLAWQDINRALFLDTPRGLAEEMSPGLRPAAWRLFVDAMLRHPWAGWGWSQIAVAQSAVALDHPSLRYTFQSTHNLVLDLLIENGLVLGGALVVLLAGWVVVKARQVNAPQARLLWMAIVVLLIHSLLEFPQNYAYFLLPAGLMAGALDALCPWGPAVAVNRRCAATVIAVGACLTLWLAVEYNLAERSLETVRFERAHVGPSRNSQVPNLVMLTQLKEFLRILRIRTDKGVSREELEQIRKVTLQFPSDGNQLLFAVAAGLNDKPDVAREALDRMCRMVPPQRCSAALQTWRQIAESSPALFVISVPKVP